MSSRVVNPTLAVLFAGVLLAALDIAIVGPALPAIQDSLAIDGRALAWIFNIYVLCALVAAPVLAKLSDLRGRRVVYLGCLLCFATGSVLVAAATSFPALLAGRAVQALGAGGLLPVASAVIADTVPIERRGRALGLIGAVFGVAFVIGPVLGGLLLRFGWQWLFLINLPLVAAVMVASWSVLPHEGRAASGRFDWLGALTLAVMLVALAFGLSARTGFATAGACLALAALAAFAFWAIERRAREPIFHPELFASRQLKVVGGIALATGLVEASMVFLPALSVEAFGVSAGTASFMMLPLVATLIVGAPLAGLLLDRIGARAVIQGGLGLTVTGLFLFALSPLSVPSFYGAGVCTGLGLSGLLGAPLRFIVLKEAGSERRGAGQGLLTLFMSTGRIAGAALIGGIAASGADQFSGHREALFYLGLVCCLALATSAALEGRAREPRPG